MAQGTDPLAAPSAGAAAGRTTRPLWEPAPAAYAVTALLVAAAFLLTMVAKSGIWDPHELDRAELARRIAVELWGASSLRLPSDPPGLPTLTDLGMGELPFTSMAVGFRWLGLHDYAGRLPLAIWGLAGAIALWLVLRRLASPRAALYGVVALVTMPLYFMQARTMLGDIVTMAGFAACFGGLSGAMLDDLPRGRLRRAATLTGWLALALVGAASGYMSRGLIVGVAAPVLGVGLGWLVLVAAGASFRAQESIGVRQHVVGGAALALGAAALALALPLLLARGASAEPLRRALGLALVASPSLESTFDLVFRELGHSLFPWSALIPFAAARILRAPPDLVAAEGPRTIGLRVLLVVGASVAFGVHALVAPHVEPVPFAGVALLAAIAAIAIHDVERGALPSPVVGVGAAVLCFVLWRDIAEAPQKALSVFCIDEKAFPKDFEGASKQIMLAAALVFSAIVLLGWLERGLEGSREPLRRWASRRADSYRRGARDLARLWRGNLLFGALLVEASLVGLGGMLWVGRRLGWPSVSKLSYNLAFLGLNAWWAVVIAPAAALLAFEVVRAGFGLALRWLRVPRASSTVVAALVAGGLLSFGYYPALAARLSPREVFVRYAALHAPGEPLAVLSLAPRSVRYYAGGERVEAVTSPQQAYRWLTEPPEPDAPSRRWVVLRSKDLPQLNALFRQSERRNLPVIDASSGAILLGSNELGGAPNRNWLEPYVLSEAPTVQHPVRASFGDDLDALGWDVRDERGKLVDHVVPGREYWMRFYYRVKRNISRNYKAFLHIDGHQRRHNGDHDVIRGQVPLNLWQPGDVMVDELAVVLEPNFTPGAYNVFYGFFQGSTRLKVTEGPAHDDRINGGTLAVR